MIDFREIIDRIKFITGYTQKDIATEIFGISDKNLSNKIKRGSVDLDSLIKWSINASVDLTWLLTGKGNPYINGGGSNDGQDGIFDPATPYTSSNVIVSKYADIIRQFKDKPRAKSAGLDLLTLERINKTAFIETCAYIKGVTNGIQLLVKNDRSYIGTERREKERRTSEPGTDIPWEPERRNGTDRRKPEQGG
ncbi:MAG: helix-turn-helix domain-containing protein [Desulfosarcina sp.]|nr:helix-turn-helix domain-containing protein [Desulfosarcina sp.]MBC2742106.1 helix-turn-helix domain-containing protein [Desulfosarcina sp.]MBC2765019.1 bacteriophage CI repressor [Desulfosarcina sp.]